MRKPLNTDLWPPHAHIHVYTCDPQKHIHAFTRKELGGEEKVWQLREHGAFPDDPSWVLSTQIKCLTTV